MKITPEEFRKIGKKKDWSNYCERVSKRIKEIADRYGKARRKSLSKLNRY